MSNNSFDPIAARPQTLETLTRVLKIARELGATAAETAVGQSSGLSVTVRLGELETVQHNRDKGLSITVYDGLRKGTSSTSDFSDKAIRESVDAALAIARHGGEDRYAGLADPALLAAEVPDLDLYHPWDLSVEAATAMAIECEAAARGQDRRITNSEGATIGSNSGIHGYANSNGFLGAWTSSMHRLSCAVIGSDGDGMQQDYGYSVSRRADALRSPAEIGTEAAERTVRRLGARKVETASVPVIFEARVAASLFGHFIGAISGGSLYRHSSFLLDQLGESVFPAWLTLDERPFLPQALASRPFDADGVAPREHALVQDGVLKSYVLSAYSARRLGMETTGNASGVSNLIVSHGEQDLKDLLRQMGRGMLVTDLMGFGANIVTGDYSRGANGFWVENGEIVHPVEEVTIAGNLKDMFRSIVAVGSDIDPNHSLRTGSVLVDGMTVAGK
jgi:PmbA protein